jgi:hypothetical protein
LVSAWPARQARAAVTEAELAAFCAGKIATYKIPR